MHKKNGREKPLFAKWSGCIGNNRSLFTINESVHGGNPEVFNNVLEVLKEEKGSNFYDTRVTQNEALT